MTASLSSLVTSQSLLCFLYGFYKEREWLEANEVKQKQMMSITVLTSSRSVGVTMRASASRTSLTVLAMLPREISPIMLVFWAKSTALSHIGSEGVATPSLSNRIDSPSKFIEIANILLQGIGFRSNNIFVGLWFDRAFAALALLPIVEYYLHMQLT
jgi:hypothetical protein